MISENELKYLADMPVMATGIQVADMARELLQRRWIPVSERLPKEKQEVIVINKYCCVSNWVYSKALINTFTDFTHWMPLPELPEVE